MCNVVSDPRKPPPRPHWHSLAHPLSKGRTPRITHPPYAPLDSSASPIFCVSPRVSPCLLGSCVPLCFPSAPTQLAPMPPEKRRALLSPRLSGRRSRRNCQRNTSAPSSFAQGGVLPADDRTARRWRIHPAPGTCSTPYGSSPRPAGAPRATHDRLAPPRPRLASSTFRLVFGAPA